MAKKEKIVLTTAQRQLGSMLNAKADELAKAIAPQVQGDIDRLILAKQEWEGGKFVVMFRLTAGMTPEQLAELPDPKSEDGNNPAHYYAVKMLDGKEKIEKVYYYERLAQDFPANQQKMRRIDQLNRSMQDPNKVNTSDIGNDILGTPDGKGGRVGGMTHHYRHAEIKRLTDEITSSVNSVVGAFELFHQFRKFTELKYVEAFPLYKIGPDNLPLDGNDGRERVIENTKTPIVVQSTVKGREGIDTVRIPITTFLKYDVEKAKENHGTYQAVIDTAKRVKPTDEQGNQNEGNTSVPQLIRTPDTFIARLVDQHEFAEFAWDQKDDKLIEGIKRKLTGAGSDDAFVSAMALRRFLNEVCPDSPRNTQRYQELIGKDDPAADAA